MRSEGQDWAIAQIEEIAQSAGGVLEILEVVEPSEDGAGAVVLLSILCRDFTREENGIPLRDRERVKVTVPQDFPLTLPFADFPHNRYAGYPHVQWGHHMCMYAAPDVEWDPNQGMIGFIERLVEWLKAAAADRLDPEGMPLHPPVAYSKAQFFVVPHEDTPMPDPPFWSGYARIKQRSDLVVDLGEWIPNGAGPPAGPVACTILLPATMPFEFPATMFDLLKALVERGVPVELLRLIVELGALSTDRGTPALFVLGAAMRGMRGGARRQHLACWQIDADQTDLLRDAVIAATPEKPINIETFYSWAAEAKVQWVRVLEERPEIVERRDAEAPAKWWHGRHVAVLGCGAIGSAVAMMVARAGAARLDLYDNAIVTPGILVRQNFRRACIGYTKCSAVRVDVNLAMPDMEVTAHTRDIKRVLESDEERAPLFSADVIIDATASRGVAVALEAHFRRSHESHPPIIAMTLGHNADMGMMNVTGLGSSGSSFDLDRRTKLALTNSAKGAAFLEEFWPMAASRRVLFQPEPGCSSPTFRGSYTDVLSLVSRMTNIAAAWLAESRTDSRSFALNLAGGGLATGAAREIELSFPPDHILTDPRHGYQIRLSKTAKASLLSWMRRSERTRGNRTETGGLLFGQVDEFLKIAWIDEVSGPPPDSSASPAGFVCGTDGVAEMQIEKSKRSRGSVGFIGMWHTHPQDLPIPSPTDNGAMEKLLAPDADFARRRFLMLIVGGSARAPIPAGHIFEKAEYAR